MPVNRNRFHIRFEIGIERENRRIRIRLPNPRINGRFSCLFTAQNRKTHNKMYIKYNFLFFL